MTETTKGIETVAKLCKTETGQLWWKTVSPLRELRLGEYIHRDDAAEFGRRALEAIKASMLDEARDELADEYWKRARKARGL